MCQTLLVLKFSGSLPVICGRIRRRRCMMNSRRYFKVVWQWLMLYVTLTLEILISKGMFVINQRDVSWIGSTPVFRLSVITIFCASAVCITVLRLAEHPELMEWISNAYKVLVGRTEESWLLRECRCWWEDNIKMICITESYKHFNWI
jgi:hypothetical protein